MCGINGIFVRKRGSVALDRGELVRSRDYMAARGPDAAGIWISDDGRVGFGHRRLAIVDLSEGGAQPMRSADGNLIVTFNGEIYNYPALRRDLEQQGVVFRSKSDTEVLLHLYAAHGAGLVDRLRGMFAFAIWDARAERLFLARDALGIKPLYYADDGRTFRFASQVKALIAGGAVSREPEPAGYAGFCLWGSVPEPWTIYRCVRQLPAGTTLMVEAAGASAPKPYFSVAALHARAASEAARTSEPEAQPKIAAALLDSVRHHLMADVPVGAFLSAGIDSGALVGLMRDAGQAEIETVTLAFAEYQGSEDDESALAAEVARTYGTRHTTRLVDRAEFEADLPRILAAMDQPSIDGVNTWFVAKAARERGLKVAVSGLGGDELFGGYPSFQDIPRWVARLRFAARVPHAGALVRGVLHGLRAERYLGSAKALSMLEYGGSYPGAYLLRRGLFMPWELAGVLGPELAREGLGALGGLANVWAALSPEPATAYGRIATLETALYMRNQLLRDTDWASMAHSLEVRVPLVDRTLYETVAPLLTAGVPGTGVQMTGLPVSGKHALALAPRTPLPAHIRERRKTGFGVPTGAWILRARGSTAPETAPALSKGQASRDWSRLLIRETMQQAAA